MNLRVIKTIKEMQDYSNQMRKEGKKIGFVPTMGYLHEGHLSLVDICNELSDVTVVSIFVNPTQFAPSEDLTKYPKDFVRDRELLNRRNADVIFYPENEEIYGEGYQTYVQVTDITKTHEGASRPTHFRGVTSVVSILFNAVKPNYAVFGQKDAQQVAVIKRMVKDLHFDVDIIVAPIVRESDGLAMSSRNIYLSMKERMEALVLRKSILQAVEMIEKGESDTNKITEKMKVIIDSVSTSDVDYISIVDAYSFKAVDLLIRGEEYFVLVACKIGSTRLIDNHLFTF